jgi:hypothetical protein
VLDGEVTFFVDDEQPDLDRLLAGMRVHGSSFSLRRRLSSVGQPRPPLRQRSI